MSTTPLASRLSEDDFLTLDGPTGVAVSINDTRRTFFQHLGLREGLYRHRFLYRRMKAEARAGMERLSAARKSRLMDSTKAPSPYTPDLVTDFTFLEQVRIIHETASLQTRGLYDIIDRGDGSNWAIRWMLWRVIRQSQNAASRATSFDVESECQAGLSSCSTASDYPSIRTPSLLDAASPTYSSPVWMPAASPYEWNTTESDSDCWDEPPRKVIRLQLHSADRRPALHNPKSPFWNHVLTAP